MFGLLFGDFVGSAYEGKELKGYHLPLLTESSTFTDDTIINIAVIDHLLNNININTSLRKWTLKHPDKGFSEKFLDWVNSIDLSSNSEGNGGAVRAVAAGWFAQSNEEARSLAESVCVPSHNSVEAITAAMAVSESILMAKNNKPVKEIIEEIQNRYGYWLNYDLKYESENMGFDASAENSIPFALFIGLSADSMEDAARKVLYVGGDTDSIAAVACAVSEARKLSFPDDEAFLKSKESLRRLDLEAYELLEIFHRTYCAK